MRDRLIELLMNTPKPPIIIGGRANGRTYQTAGNIANHLLANGVIVPPCKVGDTVYGLLGHNIIEFEVGRIAIEPFEEIGMSFYCYGGYIFDMRTFGKTVFLSREEAEKKLKSDTKPLYPDAFVD